MASAYVGVDGVDVDVDDDDYGAGVLYCSSCWCLCVALLLCALSRGHVPFRAGCKLQVLCTATLIS